MSAAPRSLELIPEPPRRILAEVAGMVTLASDSVRLFLSSPLAQWREIVGATWWIVRRCAIPLALSAFVIGFGPLGIEAGNVVQAIGAPDRAGGIYVTASVREIAAWVTAMIVAGVAGTAICADLGARKIREELDAMAVLGIPTTRLVIPWAAGLTMRLSEISWNFE